MTKKHPSNPRVFGRAYNPKTFQDRHLWSVFNVRLVAFLSLRASSRAHIGHLNEFTCVWSRIGVIRYLYKLLT